MSAGDSDEPEQDVVICGAGPVGLALTLILAGAGLRVVTLDRAPAHSGYPKARVVSHRSMELLQRWGVSGSALAHALPDDWPGRLLISADLSGPELLRIDSSDTEALRVTGDGPGRRLLTQNHLESVLLSEAQHRHPGAVRFGWTATGTAIDHRGAACLDVTDVNGAAVRLRSRYVVLADGTRGLGSARPGAGRRRAAVQQLSIRFRAPLGPLLAGRPAFIHYLVQEDFLGQLLVVDGMDDWILSVPARSTDDPRDIPRDRLIDLISRAIGDPELAAGAEIVSVRGYSIGLRVADALVDGPFVLAGDAAHEIPPTGAMGLALGLADADALGWRLIALCRGWGTARMLQDYDSERRTAARRTSVWARNCLNAVAQLPAAARSGAVSSLAPTFREYVDHPGLDLGTHTGPEDLALVLNDGTPGCRAPNHPLSDGGGTIDLLGGDPLLLCDIAPHVPAPGAPVLPVPVPVPVTVVHPAPGWQAAHGVGPGGMVVIRPDGVVSWRSVEPPSAGAIADAVADLAGHRPPAGGAR